MIAGLPGAGLSTLFYAVLLLGIGAAKAWEGAVRFAGHIRRHRQHANRRSFPSHREHPRWGETARRERRA